MQSTEILEKLVGFPTVSRQSNLDLIGYARDLLTEAGIESTLIHAQDGSRANLYATVGPTDRPGVMLSGHTDVVPVEGQAWSSDPFVLRKEAGRLYGRGTADMKGFVACALHAARHAARRELRTPLHLALSHDEEIGCIGVRSLIDTLAAAPVKPVLCIVGEPTSMQVATGHKGKTALRAQCIGREGHSALAPMALNAVHLACDLIGEIRGVQHSIEQSGARDGDYDVPYTTLHVGKIAGGVALNIVPNLCELEFEIRNLAVDKPEGILDRIRSSAAALVEEAHRIAPEADIRIEVTNAYPGLDTPPDAVAVELVKSLSGANGTIKVAFGTEGGLFSERLGVPTVICGPGSMAQGHRPDEYIASNQIARCDAMLTVLLDRLEAGL